MAYTLTGVRGNDDDEELDIVYRLIHCQANFRSRTAADSWSGKLSSFTDSSTRNSKVKMTECHLTDSVPRCQAT